MMSPPQLASPVRRTAGGSRQRHLAKVTGSLWVDVATGWPVEITLDITDNNGNKQMTIVVNDFQWDCRNRSPQHSPRSSPQVTSLCTK